MFSYPKYFPYFGLFIILHDIFLDLALLSEEQNRSAS